MLISVKRGQTGVIIRVKILDSSVNTGAGKTGITYSTSNLIIGTIADNEASTTRYRASSSEIENITTLGTFSAPTSGKCRFKEVDSVNHKGVYEIQLADARYAVSSAKSLLISISGATDVAETDVVIPLNLPVDVTSIADSSSINTYQAKVWLFDDNGGTTDRYAIAFFKNGEPITAGITSPTIQVIKMSDGTDLISSTSLTQVASLGLYKYDATTTSRITDGVSYMAKIIATIDSSARTWYQPIGRDS
jgi:hypothetical protein